MTRVTSGVLAAVMVCAMTAEAAERIVGITPSDGVAMFAKRFVVESDCVVVGCEFRNNDSRTVFPDVALYVGASEMLSEGRVLARARSISESSPGRVQVRWPTPIALAAGTKVFVGIRVPFGPGKQGDGVGPGIGAIDVERPSDSFVASGEPGELMPIRADLQIQLVMQPVGKSSKAGDLIATAIRGSVPNPLTLGTDIEFSIGDAGNAELAIYNVAGARVRVVEHKLLTPGVYMRTWDGHDEGGRIVAAGVYFAKLTSGAIAQTYKLVVAH